MNSSKRMILMYPNQRWMQGDPNTTWDLSPYALCLLGAMLKDDVNVRIIDAQFYNFSVEAVEKIIAEYQPDYVGISQLSSDYAATLTTAISSVRHAAPGCKIIVGGVYPTIEYMQVISNPQIDFVVRGEGEFVLRDLIRYLNGNGPKPKEGLVYKDKSEIVVQSQVRVEDLSILPWADYSLVNFEDYISRGARFGPHSPPEFPYLRMSVSRGCPFSCCFCQVHMLAGKKVRTRSAEDVVAELIFLKAQYGIKSVVFEDDNIMATKSFFSELLHLIIENGLNLKFIFINFAIFLLTDEFIELLSKAGCVGVNIAIESGNRRILKEIINKPVELEKAIEMIGKLKKKGLYCLVNFIIGFPGETWSEIRETIAFAEACKADYVRFFIAVPFPGTRLWDIAKQMNVLINPDDMTVDWGGTRISSSEWTAQDLKILRAYEWDRINFSSNEKISWFAQRCQVSLGELALIRKDTRMAVKSNAMHNVVDPN